MILQMCNCLIIIMLLGIAKPNGLYYGIGIRLIESLDELKSLRHSGQSYIVEERIRNHAELDKFNDTSLNTFRVVTCIDRKGTPHVVAVLLRTVRKGAVIDNLKGGGVCWHVDLQTGVIDSPGRDGCGNRYVAHPTSGMICPGFKVPQFEELKQYALQLALHLPKARYVGWDIALTPNG